MQFDTDQYPDYVPLTDYNTYDFRKRQPDVVFIHNPYDDCNFTTSIHPFFYSRNLKQYTDLLIYIPCFKLDEFDPEDSKAYYNMRYYVSVPGLAHADKILIPSERMRQTYINYLTEFAGEDTRTVWTEKIRLSPFQQSGAPQQS